MAALEDSAMRDTAARARLGLPALGRHREEYLDTLEAEQVRQRGRAAREQRVTETALRLVRECAPESPVDVWEHCRAIARVTTPWAPTNSRS